MKNSFVFLVVGALLIACNERETESDLVDIYKNTSKINDTECDVIFNSLKDFTVSGSFIKIDVKCENTTQTVILDNMALSLIYGSPRKLREKEYIKLLYNKIKNKKALEVTESAYNLLSQYSFVENIDNQLVLEDVLLEYFENGLQKKYSQNDIEIVNLLIESGYQVWREGYSGLLGIASCEGLE